MHTKWIPLIIGAVFASCNAFAQTFDPEAIPCVTTEQRAETWSNGDCERTQTCDLKNFQFNLRRTECDFGNGPEPSTVVVAGFETAQPAFLENYAIVQFIRGCVYNIDQAADGVFKDGWGMSRDFFGGTITFKHPEWVIDTNDRDPVYWSSPRSGKSRIGEYSSVNPQDPFAFNQWVKYSKQTPSNSALFVRDAPTSGSLFVSGEGADRVVSATQSSLEFRTCIYRMKDVPTWVAQPNSIDFATPLHCFDWRMSEIYDFEQKRFTHHEEISAKCFEK